MKQHFDVIALGRVGVDLYPEQTGPLTAVRSFAKSLGGSAANVVVAAARLGATASLVSRVGNDKFGEYLLSALTQFNVDTDWIVRDPDLQTPLAFAELDPPEDPGLVFYRSPKAPDLNIDESQLDEAAIAACGILWVTGTGLCTEPSRATTLSALRMRQASAAGGRSATTVLDLDWRPHFWDSENEATEQFRAALNYATVVVGNREECRIAVGTEDPIEAAERIRDYGADIAIVKMGGDGVYVVSKDGKHLIPPLDIEVVCGLGAGDAFGGALCYGLLAGWPLQRIGRFANIAGAIVASRLACADAMPTLGEVEVFMTKEPAQ